ncbi:hypothetical protein [Algoriphagus sediminis]|uniref:Uncharacterized protein n=1 Tax=Algoriphagus sediminis TaxID=3057113 RepID=A0ABT7YH37_9BACT|nr:hypothetical protein [Algoriphagus sediminis]MDN3205827.1 hypothetical protein [Algoriphagus sediminis]
MKKLLLILLLAPLGLWAQTPEAGELFTLRTLTTNEMNGVQNPIEGTLIYNSTEDALFYFDGTNWVNTEQEISVSGTFIIPEGGSAQQITVDNLPFKPSRVEFSAANNVDAVRLNDNSSGGRNNNTKENSFGFMFGFAQIEPDGTTISQQVISGGGNGNSINNISRYASDSQCIGIRYANQNGDNLGLTTATLTSFEDDGFILNATARTDAVIIIYTAYQ